MRKTILSSLLLATLVAAPASAQTNGIVTPFIGLGTNIDFCPSIGGCIADPDHGSRTVYGASVGLTGPVVGFEVDFGYSPNFFESEADDDFGEFDSDGNMTTLMGNLLVSVPLGRVRPYGTVGAGLMRANLDATDFFDDLSRNDFGVNYGGGVMVFLSDSVGIRGDIRQFRNLQNDDPDDDVPEPTDFDLGDFTFWRLSGGVTFRW